ncbi:hypothetical protein ACFQAT_01680 [Undibacterium arcticum]|uniref:hypothetical protein n=1 Tax=Undibacterium arcticum TaxID=1762892 RepID=UPI0036121A1A
MLHKTHATEDRCGLPHRHAALQTFPEISSAAIAQVLIVAFQCFHLGKNIGTSFSLPIEK